jgi:ankyrin repeat protein
MRAAAAGDERRVRELLAAGAPLRCSSDALSWTALHYASAQRNASIVAALLEADAAGALLKADTVGALVDAQDSISGATPLMLASSNGHEGAARALLEHGAPHGTSGPAALHDSSGTAAAAASGVTAALARRDFRGRTPLALAILFGHAATEAMLRAHGAS